MKDIQGYLRGKCNSCSECQEYREPPHEEEAGGSSDKPRRLRCEYCNHTPVEHVWIVELGECTKCGEDNCDKYESEDKNSYTDCGYCGCSASCHKGAEKLRAKTPVKPRVDPSGTPVQLSQHGKCKLPGCPYPRRVEHGTPFDYCSKTCAVKHRSTGGSSGTTSMTTSHSPSVSIAVAPTQSMTPTTAPVPLLACTACKIKPAAPGYPWCSVCYSFHQAQRDKNKQ